MGQNLHQGNSDVGGLSDMLCKHSTSTTHNITSKYQVILASKRVFKSCNTGQGLISVPKSLKTIQANGKSRQMDFYSSLVIAETGGAS